MKLKQLFIILLFVNSVALISVVFILSEYQNAIKQLRDSQAKGDTNLAIRNSKVMRKRFNKNVIKIHAVLRAQPSSRVQQRTKVSKEKM